MRKILALMICLWTVAAYGEPPLPPPILPPPEYDYYYPGGFVVFTLPSHAELVRMCGEGHDPFPSCSGKDANGTCVILALPRDEIAALGYTYDAVKRHEFGHCNGWPKNHPGARNAP
jgi:hypothetical protein